MFVGPPTEVFTSQTIWSTGIVVQGHIINMIVDRKSSICGGQVAALNPHIGLFTCQLTTCNLYFPLGVNTTIHFRFGGEPPWRCPWYLIKWTTVLKGQQSVVVIYINCHSSIWFNGGFRYIKICSSNVLQSLKKSTPITIWNQNNLFVQKHVSCYVWVNIFGGVKIIAT